MIIKLEAGKYLEGTQLLVESVYPHFIICRTSDNRQVTFNVGDLVTGYLDSRPIWEQEDDYFLDKDSYFNPYYRA